MAIGRISGPLLKQNLIRDGVNLAFETDLLFLDVVNSRIGVNSVAPQYALDVVGTARTSNLQVANQLNVGNFTVTGNTISSTLPTINFIASGDEATVYHSRVIVNDIEMRGNTIATTVSNSNLELQAHGTGIIDIKSNARVSGDIRVTGNIFADGDITIGGNLIIGDNKTDTVVINASITSSLIPKTDNAYDLGSSLYKWRNIYATNLNASLLTLDTFQVGDISISGNRISTVTNQDLILSTNGVGSIVLGNFSFNGNTITNTVSNAVTQLRHTATGYLKIVGTNGFVPPKGTTGERPTGIYAVEGMMRYNSDAKALEIYDGLSWTSPSGSTGAVSEIQANDIAMRFALTLG